jgi:hypothetical protein
LELKMLNATAVSRKFTTFSNATLIGVLFLLSLMLIGQTLSTVYNFGFVFPFQDQYFAYQHYMRDSFPVNVIQSENGHRPIFPALIRVSELVWLDGAHDLQRVIGSLLMLATLGLWYRFAVSPQDTQGSAGQSLAASSNLSRGSGVRRATIVFLITIALFWMGSMRMQIHANEQVAIYGLMLGLAIALHSVPNAGATPSRKNWIGMMFGALLSAFSFGNGLVVFPVLIAVAIMQRLPRKDVLRLIVVTIVVAFIYRKVLPDRSTTLAPNWRDMLSGLSLVPAWLNGVFYTAYYQFIDWDAAKVAWLNSLAADSKWAPELARSLFAGADSWKRFLWAMIALGWVMIGAAIAIVLWHLRYGFRSRLQLFAVSLMLFSLGTGMLIVMFRASYFLTVHPTQIFADRYVIWSCLWWLGFALYAVDAISRLKAKFSTPVHFGAVLTVLLMGWSLTFSHLTGMLWAKAASAHLERVSLFWSQEIVTAEDVAVLSTMPEAATRTTIEMFKERKLSYFSDFWQAAAISAPDYSTQALAPQNSQAKILIDRVSLAPSARGAGLQELTASIDVDSRKRSRWLRLIGRDAGGKICGRAWQAFGEQQQIPFLFIGPIARDGIQGVLTCATPAVQLKWLAVDEHGALYDVVWSATAP